jgi:hypothetical protein
MASGESEKAKKSRSGNIAGNNLQNSRLGLPKGGASLVRRKRATERVDGT